MSPRIFCKSAFLVLAAGFFLMGQESSVPIAPHQKTGRENFYHGTPANPKIQAMVAAVSAARIRADLAKLESFGTRHTNSDTVSETRGIGAARRWIKNQMQEASTATGGALRPEFFFFNSNICGIAGLHANVMASLTGAMPQAQNRLFLVSGHMDNRTFDTCDRNSFAPGTNDDGSGTVASMELARVMSSFQYDASLIFMTVTGEDEGLFGSRAYANFARANNFRIDGMLTNDVVGNVIDSTGVVDSTSVRHFSLGPSTSPSRQLARYFKLKGEQYVPGMTVNLIPSQDRPGRGGDHIPFNDNGYAAVRFTEPAERLRYQHSNLDLLGHMSPSYTAQVTRLSLAGLASLAWAPAMPTASLIARDVGNGADIALTWTNTNNEPDFAGYRVAWRHPDSLFYQGLVAAGNVTQFTLTGLTPNRPAYISYSALDAEGNESVFSPEFLVTPAAIPQTPQSFASTSSAAHIRLVWQANLEQDLADYLIIRTGSGIAEQQFVVDKNAISFIDHAVQPHVLYRYRIQARDRDGNASQPSLFARGQLATHDRGLFVLDGTKDGAGQALQPSDEEVDGYYMRLLQRFNFTGQWDLADSAQQQLAVSDADLGIYSTVIVHSEVTPPAKAISADTTALRKYLQAGGRLLLIGWGLLGNVSGIAQQVIKHNPGSFVRDYLQIDSSRAATVLIRDFKGADAVAPNYPALTVDPVKAPSFNGNLRAMEVFEALAAGSPAQPLYIYRSSAQPPTIFHGKPVALRHLSPNLRVIVLDFPLYFMPETDAAQVLRQALIDLGETPTAVAEQPLSTPLAFALGQNYPNPLRVSRRNAATRIQYQLPKAVPVKLAIYNLAGQQVATLVDRLQPAGFHALDWQGKDQKGRALASGVYLYRLETKEFVHMRKLVLVQ